MGLFGTVWHSIVAVVLFPISLQSQSRYSPVIFPSSPTQPSSGKKHIHTPLSFLYFFLDDFPGVVADFGSSNLSTGSFSTSTPIKGNGNAFGC